MNNLSNVNYDDIRRIQDVINRRGHEYSFDDAEQTWVEFSSKSKNQWWSTLPADDEDLWSVINKHEFVV